MEADDYILALMKFGKAEHLKDLLRGHLHMQSVEYFRNLEGDPARGDPHEALSYCGQPDRLVVEVRQGNDWLKVGGWVGPILIRDGSPVGNLCCLYALKASHAEAFAQGQSAEVVNVDDLRLGESVVVFLNAEEFFRRVHTAVERENLSLAQGAVEYVDRKNYSGPMGPFRKFAEFAGQSEYRLLTAPESESPRVLDVGSLEDIAFMCPCSELNARLRLRRE